jgi:hypothetical protein
MGGQGSGRLPSEETLVKRQYEKLTPIATDGDPLFLPNYSGLKKGTKLTDSDIFVPYTNATADVNLGAYKLFSNQVGLRDLSGNYYLSLIDNETLSSNRSLNIISNDNNRTITLSGNPTLSDWFNQNVKNSASPVFQGLNISTFAQTRILYATVGGSITTSSGLTFDGTNITTLGITIGANTLNTSEWANLDGINQTVATTSSPQFANLIITTGGDIKPSANGVAAINIAQADGTDFITFDTTNKRFAINDTTPDYTFDIGETTTTNSGTQRLMDLTYIVSPSSAPGASTTWLGAYYTVTTGNSNFNTNCNLIGFETDAQTASGNTAAVGALYGYYGLSTHRGSGLLSSLVGMDVLCRSTGTGNITNGYGVKIDAPQQTSTGVFVTNYGVNIANQGLSGITTAYGLYINTQSGATTNWSLYVNGGNSYLGGTTIHNAPVRLKGYTVATLPAGTQGDTAFVTDALAPAFLTAVAGGGAVVTPVFYNGTNWIAY